MFSRKKVLFEMKVPDDISLQILKLFDHIFINYDLTKIEDLET